MTERRSKKLLVFYDFVVDLKNLSKCTDKQTAAIIINHDFDQVYSIGINGGPKGLDDCLCKVSTGKYTCIHAEANAIAKCHAEDKNKVMICTLSPCVTCAALIINSGFSTVYYIDTWKDTTGIDMLRSAGINATKLYKGERLGVFAEDPVQEVVIYEINERGSSSNNNSNK